MNIRQLTAALLLVCLPTCALGQPSLLIIGQRAPAGVTVVPAATYETVAGIGVVPKPVWTTAPPTVSPPNGQHVIPRYGNGSSHPAGSLIGWGPRSIIRATSSTASRPVPAIVITEGYGETLNQFTAGADGAAVLRPYIGHVTISGYDPLGADWAGTGGNMNPATWAATAFSYDGMRVKATAPTIEHVGFFGIPGTCLYVAGNSGAQNGQNRLYDAEKGFVGDLRFGRALRGVEINVIDVAVGRMEGREFRDYGIKFSTGAAQVDGAQHWYGIDRAGTPGAAVWIPSAAGQNWIDGSIYAEQAKYGVLIEGSGNSLAKVYSKVCDDANIYMGGERNTVDYAELEVEANSTGVIIVTHFNRVLSGKVFMAATTSVGVNINSGGNAGNGIVLRDMTFVGASTTLGTAINVQETLNDSTIIVHFETVGTGLDVDAAGVSKIGNGNTIIVTSSAGTVATPIDLPDTWTTTPTTTTNYVTIDGVRWYPP